METVQTSQTAIVRPTKYNPIPLETKAAILEDAKVRIFGETILQIAQSHGIDKVTLNMWLLAEGDYAQLRQAATDKGLIEAQDAIDTAGIEYDAVLIKARDADRAFDEALINATSNAKALTEDELNAAVASAKTLKLSVDREAQAAQFTLMRAKEVFNSRFRVASVRDGRYAAKQEVATPPQQPSSLSPDRISELLDIMQAGLKAKAERVIEHDPD